MDIEQVIKLVNGVGFPVVMCLALFYTNSFMLNKQSELLSEFKDAINRNIVLTERRNERAEYIIGRIEQLDAKINLMECRP